MSNDLKHIDITKKIKRNYTEQKVTHIFPKTGGGEGGQGGFDNDQTEANFLGDGFPKGRGQTNNH